MALARNGADAFTQNKILYYYEQFAAGRYQRLPFFPDGMKVIRSLRQIRRQLQQQQQHQQQQPQQEQLQQQQQEQKLSQRYYCKNPSTFGVGAYQYYSKRSSIFFKNNYRPSFQGNIIPMRYKLNYRSTVIGNICKNVKHYYDQETRRDVAIKCSPVGIVNETLQQWGVTIETKIAFLLRMGLNRNIIRQIACHKTNSTFLSVMEMALGGNFSDFTFKPESRDTETIKSLFFQIALGIEYMHNKCGIAHLDLKLENIVLDTKYECVKICDFDKSHLLVPDMSRLDKNSPDHLSALRRYQFNKEVLKVDIGKFEYYLEQEVDSVSVENELKGMRDVMSDLLNPNIDYSCVPYKRMTEAFGTFAYMSPYMLSRVPWDPRSADIYSLGVILFVLLTEVRNLGTVPDDLDPFNYYKEHTAVKLLNKGGYKLDSEALDLLHNMVTWHDKDRFTIKQVLQHPWFGNMYIKECQRRRQDSRNEAKDDDNVDVK